MTRKIKFGTQLCLNLQKKLLKKYIKYKRQVQGSKFEKLI